MHLPRLPPRSPKHREERLKLAASGLQTLALTLFAAVLIAPLVNTSLAAPFWVKLLTSFIASVAEGVAFILLRYIPVTNVPKEPTDG